MAAFAGLWTSAPRAAFSVCSFSKEPVRSLRARNVPSLNPKARSSADWISAQSRSVVLYRIGMTIACAATEVTYPRPTKYTTRLNPGGDSARQNTRLKAR
jgi:hypothetical protein